MNKKLSKLFILIEIIIGILSIFLYVIAGIAVGISDLDITLKYTLIAILSICFLIIISCLLKIEQHAGYYQCKHCKFLYVPKYSKIYFAPHIGTRRYLKCPNCWKKSWHCKRFL